MPFIRHCVLLFSDSRLPDDYCRVQANANTNEGRHQLPAAPSRRTVLALPSVLLASAPSTAALAAAQPAESNCESCSNSNLSLQEGDKAFVTTASGLRILELREGTGAEPAPGQTCVVDWVGYTAGYQAKRIESTRETDSPFVFKLGQVGCASPACHLHHVHVSNFGKLFRCLGGGGGGGGLWIALLTRSMMPGRVIK